MHFVDNLFHTLMVLNIVVGPTYAYIVLLHAISGDSRIFLHGLRNCGCWIAPIAVHEIGCLDIYGDSRLRVRTIRLHRPTWLSGGQSIFLLQLENRLTEVTRRDSWLVPCRHRNFANEYKGSFPRRPILSFYQL